jgi:hypothetical protein
MNMALRQCNAVNHISVSNAYGCVSTFNVPNGPCELHLRDPESFAKMSDFESYGIFRHSYASWFDFLGISEMADWCRSSLRETNDFPLGTQKRLTSFDYRAENPLTVVVINSLGFRSNRARLLISPSVAEALFDFKAFQKLNWKDLRVSNAENSNEDGSPIFSQMVQLYCRNKLVS